MCRCRATGLGAERPPPESWTSSKPATDIALRCLPTVSTIPRAQLAAQLRVASLARNIRGGMAATDGDSLREWQGTPEIGSLTAHSPDESHFIGSSSGVYFVNTVKKAFADSSHTVAGIPPATETVGGTEDAHESGVSGAHVDSATSRRVHVEPEQASIVMVSESALPFLPPKDVARQLSIEYFRNWHPIFPFLPGSRILEDMDQLYSDERLLTPGTLHLDRQRSCKLLIFLCVFNIGATHLPPSALPSSHRFLSPSEVFSAAAPLSTRHDTLTIQTMLAAQLFCVVKMAFRTASSLGGLVQRLITHAGLHRCPFRYINFDDEDRHLRKRVFWSSYALERFLSQSLGLPLTMSDADIDVCVPTADEVHNTSNPLGRPGHASTGPSSHSQNLSQFQYMETSAHSPLPRETVLANYIEYCRLVGRALELYHKSIHVRSVRQAQALYLRSDIDRWFNNLPQDLQVETFGKESQQPSKSNLSRFAMFFTVLYQQIIILVHRPSLSLPRNLPEFQYGLQIALGAARSTLSAVEQHTHLIWPGCLSSVWMSGLIIAFACQVQSYSRYKGSRYVLQC